MKYEIEPTWAVMFIGEYPMWRVVADTAEEAIRMIAESNNIDPKELEAK